MPRRAKGGGGNVALQYTQTALQLMMYVSVAMVVVLILAAALGQVAQQFPVTQSNPLYNVTATWQRITGTVTSFASPLVLIGIAIVLIVGVILLLRIF